MFRTFKLPCGPKKWPSTLLPPITRFSNSIAENRNSPWCSFISCMLARKAIVPPCKCTTICITSPAILIPNENPRGRVQIPRYERDRDGLCKFSNCYVPLDRRVATPLNTVPRGNGKKEVARSWKTFLVPAIPFRVCKRERAFQGIDHSLRRNGQSPGDESHDGCVRILITRSSGRGISNVATLRQVESVGGHRYRHVPARRH